MKTREIVALVRASDDASEVRTVCPEVGFFRAHVAVGDLVRPGTLLGELDTLGLVSRVIAPETARGVVTAVAAPGAPLDYGALIALLDPSASTAALSGGPKPEARGPSAAAAAGLVFRAPTSGRFYGRSSPDKPPFVEIGSELAAGATICLLEVMKTFHRVTYAATVGLPERARVVAVLVADGADVNAGEPLLALAST